MIGGQPVCELTTVCLALSIEDICVRRVECAKSFEVWSEGESFVPHYHIQIVNQSYFTEGQYNSENTGSHHSNNFLGFHYLLLQLNMGTEIVFILFVFVSRD
jgi:hypothetical protein